VLVVDPLVERNTPGVSIEGAEVYVERGPLLSLPDLGSHPSGAYQGSVRNKDGRRVGLLGVELIDGSQVQRDPGRPSWFMSPAAPPSDLANDSVHSGSRRSSVRKAAAQRPIVFGQANAPVVFGRPPSGAAQRSSTQA
jgi:hypothetical protein